MSLLLLFFLLVGGFILVCVVAAQIYPRATGQSEARAEPDITGAAPEAGRVGPDDAHLG